MRELSRRSTAPETIGTDVIAIPAGEPLDLEIRLESVGRRDPRERFGPSHGDRGLRAVPGTGHLPGGRAFQELFAYADRAAHHHEVGADADGADEDVVRVLEGDMIDLEPVIRDAVVPSLPFQPVCRVDCPGCAPSGERCSRRTRTTITTRSTRGGPP